MLQNLPSNKIFALENKKKIPRDHFVFASSIFSYQISFSFQINFSLQIRQYPLILGHSAILRPALGRPGLTASFALLPLWSPNLIFHDKSFQSDSNLQYKKN
jgi:hypothetical protein